jgi:Rod binding domain-containing protein
MRVAPPIQAPGPDASPEAKKTFHEQREAARAFEAIFVRRMLSSLEKTSKPGATGESGGGSGGIYASIMVGSLADAVAGSGGIGLADLVLQALQPTQAPKK